MSLAKTVNALLALIAFTANPALAHSFNVALMVPGPDRGRQILEGFRLATAERDSHPDQESDGHLGGLDVYVTVIDEQGDGLAALGTIDIVAAFVAESTIRRLLDEENTAVLLPGQTPFAEPGLPAVAAFISAYEKKYGRKPTSQAARGYHAARRIDVAVRAQGGASDTALLRHCFTLSAGEFTW